VIGHLQILPQEIETFFVVGKCLSRNNRWYDGKYDQFGYPRLEGTKVRIHFFDFASSPSINGVSAIIDGGCK
jgi:hypothetical protein